MQVVSGTSIVNSSYAINSGGTTFDVPLFRSLR
jgi:hypothetical protein